MKTIEQLKAKRETLINEIIRGNDNDTILAKIKQVDNQIQNAKLLSKLTTVNAEQSRKRAMALQVWECERPTDDITCNDGSFHSTKIKRYPKLAALPYAKATFKNGIMTGIRTNRDEFQLAKYDGTPYESFAEFLEANYILPTDITIEQLESIIAANEAANEQLKQAIQAHSQSKDNLKIYTLAHIGLFSQDRAEHVYNYSINL